MGGRVRIYQKYIGIKNILKTIFFSSLSKKKSPLVINLNANDICNSKCVMCNIWQQNKQHEITPDELRKLLKNRLYTDVQHVGITGGEPTLRDDLIHLYEACIDSLPNLKGLSIITNAIQDKQVIERTDSIIQLCQQNNISFSIMVSLDGVGDTHDKVRGRKGNFESAIRVINYLKSEYNIPVSIGCTISKENVWEVDEMLDFIKLNEINGRFRVAEFINRLYNDKNTDVIRNFTPEEAYHLALFFYKLEYTYEKNYAVKNTYKSIRNILLGGTRLIHCPYQNQGVVVNSKGELSYCAPKSPIIGNGIESDSEHLFKKNKKLLNSIIKNDCKNCIHDYHSEPKKELIIEELKTKFFKKLINIYKPNRAKILSIGSLPKSFFITEKLVFIVGWYGTETVGDKAILAGIIDDYLNKNPDTKFVVASLFPFITHQTIKELCLTDIVNIIPTYSLDFIRYSKFADEVVMGGGPLMDLVQLGIPLTAFKIAKLYGNKRVIKGCGIGPITLQKYKKAIHEIINLSTNLEFRDKASLNQAKTILKEKRSIKLSGDYAIPYIQKINKLTKSNESNEIACFLRDWTYEYYREVSSTEFAKIKKDFETGIATFIKAKADELKVENIRFYHMHNFIVGNDDRDFSRRFIKEYFSNDFRAGYDKQLSTVENTVMRMKSSRLNICMRFHSVLFANTLGSNLMAIDYTNGGKIYNYLHDNNQLNKLLTISELTTYNVLK